MYEYFEHCIHAARLYILKETDDTIPAARRHMKVYVSFNLIEINPDISRVEFTRISLFYFISCERSFFHCCRCFNGWFFALSPSLCLFYL